MHIPMWCPYQVFTASDGNLIVAVGTQFQRLCRHVLVRPDLAEDARFGTNSARPQNREALAAALQSEFVKRTRDEWLTALLAANVPGGAVKNVVEALTSPEATARNMVSVLPHATEGPISVLNSPLKFSETQVVPPRAPPVLGEHSEFVLREILGRSDREIDALTLAKVVIARSPAKPANA